MTLVMMLVCVIGIFEWHDGRAQRPASQVLCISMGCGPSIAPSCKGILDKIWFVDIFRGVPHVIGNPTDTKTVMFYFGTSSGCIMYLFAFLTRHSCQVLIPPNSSVLGRNRSCEIWLGEWSSSTYKHLIGWWTLREAFYFLRLCPLLPGSWSWTRLASAVVTYLWLAAFHRAGKLSTILWCMMVGHSWLQVIRRKSIIQVIYLTPRE